MINVRNTILDAVSGINKEEVLNPVSKTSSPFTPDDLAKKLGSIIKKVRSQAYEPASQKLDYTHLANSRLYQQFRVDLSPALANLNLNQLSEPNQQKAFWINLYNALVIDAVIQYQVESSVAEGFLGLIRFFRQAAYNVGGYRFSLEDIEHGILRANQGNPFIPGRHFAKTDPRIKFVLPELDPRIHFAINCASASCPPINTFSASDLDLHLDLAARSFISQEVILHRNHLVLCVSSIFKWFLADFGGFQGLAGFLRKYLPEGKRLEWLKHQSSPQFEFTPYNWALNSPNF